MLFASTTLAQPGTLDPTFGANDQGFAYGDGAEASLNAILLRPDGRMLIGGWLDYYNGSIASGVACVEANGDIHPGFTVSGGTNDEVTCLALQPDGKVVVGGAFTTLAGAPLSGIGRLNDDGSVDTTFDPGTGATGGDVLAVALQADGRIIVCGDFTAFDGVPRNRIARLEVDGTLDLNFDPGTGANQDITSVVVQPDGNILIGGHFYNINGSAQIRIARLLPTGALDPSFLTGNGAQYLVKDIALQPDGRILVAGFFSAFNDVPRNGIVRLNTDGSVDTSFDPGTGAEGGVLTVRMLADGRIMVAGSLSSFDGTPVVSIARLFSDGSLDASFDPGSGANGAIHDLAIQPDDEVLVAGAFSRMQHRAYGHLARLATDGAVDPAFAQATGANARVSRILLQPDGRILLAGPFWGYYGGYCGGITRALNDGSPDPEFDPGTGTGGFVKTVGLQPDGRILIGGIFVRYGETPRPGLARLMPDGPLDLSFEPNDIAGGWVNALAVQPDGKVMIAGNFTAVGNTSRNGIARLNTDGTLDLTFDPGTGTSAVADIALQPDGRMVLVGDFDSYNGAPAGGVVRINADGSLDGTFTHGSSLNTNQMYRVVLQPDGKILLGSNWPIYNGESAGRIARLNSDGSIDTGFMVEDGPNGNVFDIAVQPDGRIIIVGYFSEVADVPRGRVARLQPDGGLDLTFDPTGGSPGYLYATAVQPDGGILIGGDMTSYAGSGRDRIARLFGTPSTGTGDEATPLSGIYPNPLDGEVVHIPVGQFDASALITVDLFDATGRTVARALRTATAGALITFTLPADIVPGAYRVRTAQGSRSATGALIVR